MVAVVSRKSSAVKDVFPYLKPFKEPPKQSSLCATATIGSAFSLRKPQILKLTTMAMMNSSLNLGLKSNLEIYTNFIENK
jgi:hypothetical protein